MNVKGFEHNTTSPATARTRTARSGDEPSNVVAVFGCNSDRRYINNSLHLARKYARIFVRGHYLLREANSFRERSSRKTVSFEEQIMSKDKYPSIFSPQMETIVFIFLQIFYAARPVLKTGGYLVNKPLPSAGISADNVRG